MKNRIGRIFVCFLSLILSCVLFMPKINSYASAEEAGGEKVEVHKYTLIGSDFNSNTNILQSYNIAPENVTNFTPFDLSEGQRLGGNSFTLDVGERNQIENQYVKVENVDIPEGSYSLFVWIYFDSIFLHNLTISLTLINGATLEWELNNETLIELLKKTSDVTMLSMPFSWNQIELPFNLATVTGEIYENNYLSDVEKIYIDFTSEELDIDDGNQSESGEEQEIVLNYATLSFYDIYISGSTNSEEFSVEKQNFRFYEFDFYSQEFRNNILIGDTITLLTKSQAVKYAWNGKVDLKNNSNSSIVWTVMVKTPNKDNQFVYLNFGDRITFDEVGTYEIYYLCKDLSISNNEPIISESVIINVRKMRGVYFDKTSYELQTGKTYMLNVYTSSAFVEVTELRFEADSENVIIENRNGNIAVTVNTPGQYIINAYVKGRRKITYVEKEYTESIKLKVSEPEEENDRTIKILLYIGFGIGLIIIIGVLIKKIIDNRKFEVK